MKRILAKHTLVEFWTKRPDAKVHLQVWYETIKSANWPTPNDIKEFYAKASILKNSRVVFNIKGDEYRIVVKIEYKKQWIFIRFIGTHQDYDKINANEI